MRRRCSFLSLLYSFYFVFFVTTLSTGQLIFVSFFYDRIFLHSPFLFNRTKGTFAIFSDSIVAFSRNAFARKELSSFVAIKFALCSHRSALFLGNLFLLEYSPQMDMYMSALGDVIFVCHKWNIRLNVSDSLENRIEYRFMLLRSVSFGLKFFNILFVNIPMNLYSHEIRIVLLSYNFIFCNLIILQSVILSGQSCAWYQSKFLLKIQYFYSEIFFNLIYIYFNLKEQIRISCVMT